MRVNQKHGGNRTVYSRTVHSTETVKISKLRSKKQNSATRTLRRKIKRGCKSERRFRLFDIKGGLPEETGPRWLSKLVQVATEIKLMVAQKSARQRK
jgi:hypothetical protein